MTNDGKPGEGVKFSSFQSPRKAEQVAEEILAATRRGELRCGEQLPVETAMAKEFGVGRNCIREALRILETLDVVEVRHGLGSFIIDGTGLPRQPRWIRTSPTIAADMDMLEVREAVEVKAAQLAATHRSAEDLADIERVAGEAVELAVAAGIDIDTFAHHDQAFHAAVARATRNDFLIQLAPGSWASPPPEPTYRVEGRMLLSARQHQEISAAIAAHDPEAAGQAMSRHIRDTIARLRAIKAGSQETNTETDSEQPKQKPNNAPPEPDATR
jgi:GntR family transcriptional repressor for pyruvate dehydrogenase complex